MDKLLRLSKETDSNGDVDFIANKTKSNYINLRGINEQNAIDSVKQFMIKYGIWSTNDIILSTRKHIGFVPQNYHDISFVLVFYTAALKSHEAREQNTKKKLDEEQKIYESIHNQEINIEEPLSTPKKCVVKSLLNPNIPREKQQNDFHNINDNNQFGPEIADKFITRSKNKIDSKKRVDVDSKKRDNIDSKKRDNIDSKKRDNIDSKKHDKVDSKKNLEIEKILDEDSESLCDLLDTIEKCESDANQSNDSDENTKSKKKSKKSSVPKSEDMESDMVDKITKNISVSIQDDSDDESSDKSVESSDKSVESSDKSDESSDKSDETSEEKPKKNTKNTKNTKNIKKDAAKKISKNPPNKKSKLKLLNLNQTTNRIIIIRVVI